MSAAIFFFLLLVLLWFSPEILSDTCNDSILICGNQTLEIRYPFFSNTSSDCPRGIYHIQCINLTPMILFPGQRFVYPVFDISYPKKTLIIHDVKLSLSPYPWGPNCLFVYDFRAAPIPQVNVTQLSQLISSGGSSFFDCWRSKDYDSSLRSSVFARIYNGSSSSCEGYSLYYTNKLDSGRGLNDGECSGSASDFLWFDWMLSFDVKGEGLSLLSAGFSQSGLQPDCFSCRIKGPDCSSSDHQSSCGCTEKCPAINSGKKRKRGFIIGKLHDGRIVAVKRLYNNNRKQVE